LSKKQRLELTWIGKDERSNLEPRILLEDTTLSYHASHQSPIDRFENRLILGDNLLALKALEQELAGKVDCIYIDPPFNTQQAFAQYDDGLEHSAWLTMFRDRIELLHRLLASTGSMWVHLDDSEAHRARCVLDEVFGGNCYVATIVWEKDKGRRSDTALSVSHDYIFVYSRDPKGWSERRNLLARSEDQLKRYRNPDNDPRGPWLQGDNATAKSANEGSRFPISLPSGRSVTPPPSRGWSFSRATFDEALAEGRVYFGADGNGMPIIKRYLSDVQQGVVPRSWWSADEVGHNQEAKRDHLNKLLPDVEPFATPKPERLLQRILHIATRSGDLVLDSFAGSGTTGAVAHKMGRRWIMIEMGEHAHTHIIPRLKKVIDGQDPGGITEAVGWKGGGGFRYYRLAPSLITTDAWGNPVINKEYNAAMLAEALCKLEGFTYAPSETVYWQQGHSTERDFLYVTTANLGPDQLRQLSDDVGPDRTLLVLCTAFRGNADDYPNLTVRKIPTHVLDRCEWGKDDYSLAVANLPPAPPPPGQQNLFAEEPA
jgi:adenine-specific DNA-methyltransferase